MSLPKMCKSLSDGKHLVLRTPNWFLSANCSPNAAITRSLHSTTVLSRVQAGRYPATRKGDFPLTYEMATRPDYAAHRKSYNSWNTSTIIDAKNRCAMLIDDMFIRKFVNGTWPNLLLSEIIIKRQYNTIRVAALVRKTILPRKMYFLIGYTEEILSYWTKCPVKLELQTVENPQDLIYKRI